MLNHRLLLILPTTRMSTTSHGYFGHIILSGPYHYAIHIRKQYILQSTEGSPGSGHPMPQRQRMQVRSV